MEQKIHFFYLGNGISAWTECGSKPKPDFEAHISPEREITYYQKNTPEYFRKAVEKMAEDNMTTHDNFCILKPKNKPTKYVDTKFYGRLLVSVEFFEGKEHFVLSTGQVVDSWAGIKDIDENDDRKVFFVGNLKREYGEIHGERFGFSFSLENASNALNAIKNWKSPCWRNAVVMQGTIRDLVRFSNSFLTNLDWED